ncbi:unnamed protein product [Polarella glacialis]|uniref:Uncharacterized protein n=1 Tax=Polarella glacialis TaxID=89957 RepID=A0A813GBX4_POLGL|nr:unnamed protein product [Polarella glacialis]CAE8742362.1 unnamed protein product [Polarella glacialis]
MTSYLGYLSFFDDCQRSFDDYQPSLRKLFKAGRATHVSKTHTHTAERCRKHILMSALVFVPWHVVVVVVDAVVVVVVIVVVVVVGKCAQSCNLHLGFRAAARFQLKWQMVLGKMACMLLCSTFESLNLVRRV